MAIHNILTNTGDWLRGEGPHHQIVISSRVRLARNLRNFAFPGWAKKAVRLQILETTKPEVEALPDMADAFSVYSQDLTALEKQVLVERHLISREHAAKGIGSAVVMNRKQTLSIMINEEDHLRMQAIRSGLQLKSIFKMIDKVDTALEGKLDYAFHPQLGYLTACPTNVGTGMRASAMVHENLYIAVANGHERKINALAKQLSNLVPRFKASDYDFIIFDMPRVSPTSVSVRLGAMMDLVLLVAEAEKAPRRALKQAHSLFADTGVDAQVVLNKIHEYVPARLSGDL